MSSAVSRCKKWRVRHKNPTQLACANCLDTVASLAIALSSLCNVKASYLSVNHQRAIQSWPIVKV